jgi:hypothetical protein
MQHDRLPAGGVLYMSSVPLFLELLQRKVHVDVGASTSVAALWLFTGGAIDTVRVSRTTADSLSLRFSDTEYLLRLGADGSILSGSSRPTPGSTGEKSSLSRRDCR